MTTPTANESNAEAPKTDKMYISHQYNDLAWVTEDNVATLFPTHGRRSNTTNTEKVDSKQKKKKQTARGGVTEPFPLKLHRMLDTVEAQGRSHIISWQPHGRAFLVRNTKAFVNIVLPEYSNQKKINSFHRQLQLYGFMRITRGPDAGAYYHERFLIGRPFLCRSMYRTKVKGLFQKPIIDSNTEPNFYEMPHLQRPSDAPLLAPPQAETTAAATTTTTTTTSADNIGESDHHTHTEALQQLKKVDIKTTGNMQQQHKGRTHLTDLARSHLRCFAFSSSKQTPSQQPQRLQLEQNLFEPIHIKSSAAPLSQRKDSTITEPSRHANFNNNDGSLFDLLSTSSILQKFMND